MPLQSQRKKNMNIVLLPDGTIQTIGNPPFNLPTRTVSKRRVSTITPMFVPKKFFFQWLRKLFGEDRRVAEFTRRWSGPWIVRILATGEWSVFFKRADCVEWEMMKLNGDIDKWL